MGDVENELARWVSDNQESTQNMEENSNENPEVLQMSFMEDEDEESDNKTMAENSKQKRKINVIYDESSDDDEPTASKLQWKLIPPNPHISKELEELQKVIHQIIQQFEQEDIDENDNIEEIDNPVSNSNAEEISGKDDDDLECIDENSASINFYLTNYKEIINYIKYLLFSKQKQDSKFTTNGEMCHILKCEREAHTTLLCYIHDFIACNYLKALHLISCVKCGTFYKSSSKCANCMASADLIKTVKETLKFVRKFMEENPDLSVYLGITSQPEEGKGQHEEQVMKLLGVQICNFMVLHWFAERHMAGMWEYMSLAGLSLMIDKTRMKNDCAGGIGISMSFEATACYFYALPHKKLYSDVDYFNYAAVFQTRHNQEFTTVPFLNLKELIKIREMIQTSVYKPRGKSKILALKQLRLETKDSANKTHMCKICYTLFAEDNLQRSAGRHLQNHHENEIPQIFKCFELGCGKEFSILSKAKEHIAGHGADISTGRTTHRPCPLCQETSTEQSFSRHLRRKHPNAITNGVPGLFHCYYCDQPFQRESRVFDHISNSCTEKPFARYLYILPLENENNSEQVDESSSEIIQSVSFLNCHIFVLEFYILSFQSESIGSSQDAC